MLAGGLSKSAGRALALLVVVLLFCPGVQAGQVINRLMAKPDANSSFQVNHTLLQTVLSSHVDSFGHVDFKGLKSSPRALNQYLGQLALQSPISHPERYKSPEAAMAYWINAYHAIALRSIIDVYPIDSLNDSPGLRTQRRYLLGGKAYSLLDIENHLAKTYYWQPALFFALSDLALSSPRLRVQIYSANHLERDLDTMMVEQLAPVHSQLLHSACGETVTLPAVFHQFGGPLRRYMAASHPKEPATVMGFLLVKTIPKARARLLSGCGFVPTYRPYDSRIKASKR